MKIYKFTVALINFSHHSMLICLWFWFGYSLLWEMPISWLRKTKYLFLLFCLLWLLGHRQWSMLSQLLSTMQDFNLKQFFKKYKRVWERWVINFAHRDSGRQIKFAELNVYKNQQSSQCYLLTECESGLYITLISPHVLCEGVCCPSALFA